MKLSTENNYLGDQKIYPGSSKAEDLDFEKSIRDLIKEQSLLCGEKILTGKDDMIININHPNLKTKKEHEIHSLKIPGRKDGEGYMGIYMFYYDGLIAYTSSGESKAFKGFLKIGEAGPQSNPRFMSHHYSLKANASTLSNSIYMDDERKFNELNIYDGGDETAKERRKNINKKSYKDREFCHPQIVGDWIKTHCVRVEIRIDVKDKDPQKCDAIRHFIESSLILKYKPIYEGHFN